MHSSQQSMRALAHTSHAVVKAGFRLLGLLLVADAR
jgi:hypothetical protein